MKINRSKTQLSLAILTFSTFTLCFPKSSEAMLARSVLHDAAHIFSRSMRYIPIEPIISRSFSRYARFDGEKSNKHITRAQKLREADNQAWKEALDLRNAYNADWHAFQAKYFAKQKVTVKSDDNTSHSIYYSREESSSDKTANRINYSNGESSSQKADNTRGFMVGYLTRDVTDFMFSKPKTNVDTSPASSVDTTPSLSNSLHDRETSGDSYSNSSSSSDWDSGGGDDSDGDGGFDD